MPRISPSAKTVTVFPWLWRQVYKTVRRYEGSGVLVCLHLHSLCPTNVMLGRNLAQLLDQGKKSFQESVGLPHRLLWLKIETNCEPVQIL
jgi:hypothetical protein